MKVFATGIFDLLHPEHIRFLAAAKAAAADGPLVVGIESDRRVRQLKGNGRPIFSQHDRQQMLAALTAVDKVFILPEDFDHDAAYERVLRQVDPDLYAVSANSPYLENKRRICRRVGVQLRIVHRHNPQFSTTKIMQRLFQ